MNSRQLKHYTSNKILFSQMICCFSKFFTDGSNLLNPIPFYIVGFLAALVCSIPLFTGVTKLKYIGVSDAGNVEMKFDGLRDAIFAIFGSVTPMIVFLLCDIVTGTMQTAFTRLYRLMTILIPCLVIIFVAIPLQNVGILAFSFQSQAIFHLCGFLVRIHTCGAKIWNFSSTMIIMLLWTAAICQRMLQTFVCSSCSEFIIGEAICFMLGFTIYSRKSFLSFQYSITQYKKNGKLTYEEFCCLKNVVVLSIAIFIRLIVTVLAQREDFVSNLVALFLSQNFATLLVIALHEYALSRKVAKMEV